MQLNDVDPVIWQQMLIPGAIRMGKYADILWAVMGWSNSHLHASQLATSYAG